MIALAALLLLAAVLLVVWVVMGLNGNNANTIHFNAPGIDTNIKPLTLFLLGALTLLLIWAATRLFAAGTKRKYRQHKENKELKREHKEQEKLHKREEKAHERETVREPAPVAHEERGLRDDDVREERIVHEEPREGRFVKDGTARPVDDVRDGDVRGTEGRHYR